MLYRFQIDLSDIDRGVYESLDFRAAQHPSETPPYLLTRVLAFALCYRRGLEFTPGGLSDPDSPALRALSDNGTLDLWIEIGNPSARKLHKASKAAKQVAVFTYKNPEALLSEIKSGDVHRASEIGLFAFDPKFLRSLETHVGKNNRWTVLHQDGHLDIQIDGESFSSPVMRLRL